MLDLLGRDPLTPLIDINANSDLRNYCAVLFTQRQLNGHAVNQFPGEPCESCALAVALWGYGFYLAEPGDATNAPPRIGSLPPINYVCKLCWRYCPSNLIAIGDP